RGARPMNGDQWRHALSGNAGRSKQPADGPCRGRKLIDRDPRRSAWNGIEGPESTSVEEQRVLCLGELRARAAKVRQRRLQLSVSDLSVAKIDQLGERGQIQGRIAVHVGAESVQRLVAAPGGGLQSFAPRGIGCGIAGQGQPSSAERVGGNRDLRGISLCCAQRLSRNARALCFMAYGLLHQVPLPVGPRYTCDRVVHLNCSLSGAPLRTPTMQPYW